MRSGIVDCQRQPSRIASFVFGITRGHTAVRDTFQTLLTWRTEVKVTGCKPTKHPVYGRDKLDLPYARLISAACPRFQRDGAGTESPADSKMRAFSEGGPDIASISRWVASRSRRAASRVWFL